MDYCLIKKLMHIVSRIRYEDIQWATWIGSSAAVAAAFYTKRIWKNNLYRNEIKEITELHYKLIAPFFRKTEVGYIPSKNSNKRTETLFYYNYFIKLNLKELDFSEYMARLESTEAIKDEEISGYAKKLKEILQGLEGFFNGFMYELENIEINNDKNKIIRFEQAWYLYDKFKDKKTHYDLHYRELKDTLLKRTYYI